MTATFVNVDMETAQADFLRLKEILVTQSGEVNGRRLEMPAPKNINEAEVKAAIEAIDFTGVRTKLMFPTDGEAWTEMEALDAEKWYKMYMFLVAKYPSASVVPNRHIDGSWHQHILDTRAYAQDCQTVFGGFHHHYPYAGMEGDRDYEEWLRNTIVTEQLFVAEFGMSYDDIVGAKCTCYGGKCKSVQPG